MPTDAAPDVTAAIPASGLRPQDCSNDHHQRDGDQQRREVVHAMYYGEAI